MGLTKTSICLIVVLGAAYDCSAQVFPSKPEFDRFGGYVAIEGEATGRFHLEEISGRHMLVTPEGHGFLSIGVTHTGALSRPDQSREDYFASHFGSDWSLANQEIVTNFRKWGYNSLGYDSHFSTRKLLPHFASCSPTGKVSSWMGRQIKFPDVFSDSWKAEARESIVRMLRGTRPGPNLIGIYWTDMPAWDLKTSKRRLGRTWVDAIRALPKDAPGRLRYEQFLSDKGQNASDEDFLVLIAREVYSHIGPLTRKLAPDTLVFGERYSGNALPMRVIQEALPWIDVVSVQPGQPQFPNEVFDRLHQQTKKPVMICDHQASFRTPEHSQVMWVTLPDMASIDKSHASYLEQGFATPYLVGYHRCQYIDRFQARQKLLKQGLLQVDGKPYAELVKLVTDNNWQLHNRFSASVNPPSD